MATNTDTFSPTQHDAMMAAKASRQLSDYSSRHIDIQIQLESEGDREQIALPPIVVKLLSHILDETASGRTISISRVESDMTTSEAADYLNVSRPYLTSLLQQGKIPFHQVGSHRRVRREDIAKYKTKQREASYAAMRELQAQAEELKI
ncbi:MAG: helix-turn-helix domain-containing protein [Capsulimonas sp.]|uniref:helix-turn-helix domain-containing protein n=1 Tax=Capsulimonas sp. TaxID=2494211 RepID=UPI003267D8B5